MTDPFADLTPADWDARKRAILSRLPERAPAPGIAAAVAANPERPTGSAAPGLRFRLFLHRAMIAAGLVMATSVIIGLTRQEPVPTAFRSSGSPMLVPSPAVPAPPVGALEIGRPVNPDENRRAAGGGTAKTGSARDRDRDRDAVTASPPSAERPR